MDDESQNQTLDRDATKAGQYICSLSTAYEQLARAQHIRGDGAVIG